MSYGSHIANGLYFMKNTDDSVTITKAENGRIDSKAIFQITLDEDIWESIIKSLSINKQNTQQQIEVSGLWKWLTPDYGNPPKEVVLILTNSRVIIMADWYKTSWRTESGNIHRDEVLFYAYLPIIPNIEIDKIQADKLCKCNTEEEKWSCKKDCAMKPKFVRS